MDAKVVELKKEYTITWVILLFSLILNDFFITPWHDIALDIIFIAILAVEMVAVFRSKPGDTASENVWAFQTGWARSILVAGFTIWMCIQLADIGNGEIDISRIALAGGLCGWLLIHWIWKGRYG